MLEPCGIASRLQDATLDRMRMENNEEKKEWQMSMLQALIMFFGPGLLKALWQLADYFVGIPTKSA
jgi:hypothetical protein